MAAFGPIYKKKTNLPCKIGHYIEKDKRSATVHLLLDIRDRYFPWKGRCQDKASDQEGNAKSL